MLFCAMNGWKYLKMTLREAFQTASNCTRNQIIRNPKTLQLKVTQNLTLPNPASSLFVLFFIPALIEKEMLSNPEKQFSSSASCLSNTAHISSHGQWMAVSEGPVGQSLKAAFHRWIQFWLTSEGNFCSLSFLPTTEFVVKLLWHLLSRERI